MRTGPHNGPPATLRRPQELSGRSDVVNEGDVIQNVILPMLGTLGYNVHDKGELVREYRIPVGTTSVSADLVVMRNGKPLLVIDGKGPRENLDNYATQILSYGTLLRVRYAALCNGTTFRCYDVAREKIYWEHPASKTPEFLSKKNMARSRSGRASASREESARKALVQIEGADQFSALLYKCEDLIRDNDGLVGEGAFDQMSKMLFLKMWHEKTQNGGNGVFSPENIRKQGGGSYVRNYLFQRVQADNPDLIRDGERLEISDDTIMKIVEYLDGYALLETDIDVKGEAFEIFLGKTLTGDLGQFFTPRTIVDFAVKMADPKASRRDGRPYLVFDPCCGTGGFLISAYLHMCGKIRGMPARDADLLRRRLAREQIFGVDINPRLARVTKMNMFLHGDGHGGIRTSNGLVDEEGNPYEKKFDLIMTNPPFGNKDSNKDILEKYALAKGKKRQMREVLFIERCISCLRDGGVLAIVLPDGVLNNAHMDYVRRFIGDHAIVDAVISLPVRSFKAVGANSKTSVVFMHKKRHRREQQRAVFMAKAEEVGFERRTKLARKIGRNDLDSILDEYARYAKMTDPLEDKPFAKLSDSPPCFAVCPDLLSRRLDASYFYAEALFEPDGRYCRVRDVAVPSRVEAKIGKNVGKEIQYIEYSSIDKHVGDITNTTTHTAGSAPGRARLRVSQGDVLCARMLDSEKNVAIVSSDLDGQVASNGFVVLKPRKPMTPESLFAVLRMDSTTVQVRWRAAGTIMPSVSDDDYMNIKVPQLSKETIDEYTRNISEFNDNAARRKKYLCDIFSGQDAAHRRGAASSRPAGGRSAPAAGDS